MKRAIVLFLLVIIAVCPSFSFSQDTRNAIVPLDINTASSKTIKQIKFLTGKTKEVIEIRDDPPKKSFIFIQPPGKLEFTEPAGKIVKYKVRDIEEIKTFFGEETWVEINEQTDQQSQQHPRRREGWLLLRVRGFFTSTFSSPLTEIGVSYDD